MAKDLIRYDLLVQDALKGVVRKVLVDAAKDGLPATITSTSPSAPTPPACACRSACASATRRTSPSSSSTSSGTWRHGARLRGRPVLLRRAGAPARALRRAERLLRSVRPVRPEVRSRGGARPPSRAPAPKPARPGRGAGSEPAETSPKKPPLPTVPALAAKSTRPEARAEAPSAETPRRAASRRARLRRSSPSGRARPKDEDAPAAEVVSLDSFRKKS